MRLFRDAAQWTTFLLSLSLVTSLQEDVTLHKLDEVSTTDDKLNSFDAPLSNRDGSIFESLARLFGFSLQDIEVIINLTQVGLGLVDAVHRLFKENINGTGIDFSSLEFPGGQQRLLNMFEIITYRLDQMQDGIYGIQENLRDLTQGFPHLIRWEIALDTIEDFKRDINIKFHRFSYYQKHQDVIEESTLLDFAEHAISHDPHSISSLMANIHSMAAPSDPPVVEGRKNFAREEYEVYTRVNSELSNNLRRHFLSKKKRRNGNQINERIVRDTMSQLSLRPSIFKMLLDALETYNDCSLRQTPQQLVFAFYTMLSIVQARGYAMTAFSYALLRYYNEGNFTVEQRLSEELYNHYSRGMMKEVMNVLKQADNSYRRCDPKQHIEGETFEMVTELLQGYVENEVDLNNDNTCSKNCGYYKHANISGCYHPQTQYCSKERRCSGSVHNCRYIDADAWICHSNSTHRRYDWISYEDGSVLGKKTKCDTKPVKVDSWWRFLVHCSYCVCQCDDEDSDTSDRFISLQASMANTLDNKLVTGVRFIKKNRVLYPQIQEGKALPQGQVDQKTMKWSDVGQIDVKSDNYVEGKDYVKFSYVIRSIDLDLIEAPKLHVITGLRMRMLGQHVNLEIAVTPINFTNGELNFKKTYWVSNDNTPARAIRPREEHELLHPDDPRKSHYPTVVESHPEMYVQLQPTSLYGDVSQLTVPFFDAQPVSPIPPTWLQAVELYHKGRQTNGGFFGFRVFNYNMTRHFEDAVIR